MFEKPKTKLKDGQDFQVGQCYYIANWRKTVNDADSADSTAEELFRLRTKTDHRTGDERKANLLSFHAWFSGVEKEKSSA